MPLYLLFFCFRSHNWPCCPRFCVLARTQIVRCCCFLSMTKHRTISQQQLHNDVRLVFPRNNCLLKLAALPLQMPTAQRAVLPSFSSMYVCVSVFVYVYERRTDIIVWASARCICMPVCLLVCACACATVFVRCAQFIQMSNEKFHFNTQPGQRRVAVSVSVYVYVYVSVAVVVVALPLSQLVVGSLQIDFNRFVSVCREKATHSPHIEFARRARVKKKFYKNILRVRAKPNC